MPFTHHSHSGQFCPGHAKDQLEDIVKAAIRRRMEVFAVTEHMPRHDEDMYPEEARSHDWDLPRHLKNEADYYSEAVRLREKYGDQIAMPIGFECDWVRPESLDLINQSLSLHKFDFFMGSVHHVHTIPIDYDTDTYVSARFRAGGTDERLFEDYFDWQLELLQKLRPPVVGHFDLIRLKSDDPDRSFQSWPGVWEKLLRNLDFASSYGAILEINTAAWRKGMREPYPAANICKEYLKRGGRFCLSDDSHGIDHIATNYERLPNFLETTGIAKLYCIVPKEVAGEEVQSMDSRFPNAKIIEKDLGEFRSSQFWKGAFVR